MAVKMSLRILYEKKITTSRELLSKVLLLTLSCCRLGQYLDRVRALSNVQLLHPIGKEGVLDWKGLVEVDGVSAHFGHFCFFRDQPFFRSVFSSNFVLSPSKDSLRLMLRGGIQGTLLYASSASKTVLIISRWL